MFEIDRDSIEEEEEEEKWTRGEGKETAFHLLASETFSQNWIFLGFLCSTSPYSQVRSCSNYKCVSSLDGARAA